MNDIQIVTIDDLSWNTIVKSFSDWDIYHTREYNYSLKIHGDGEPLLIYFAIDNQKVLDIVIKSDISDSKEFSFLSKNKYYDLETPYGYGGPLLQGQTDILNIYYQKLQNFCIKNNIVSEFIRFHPQLKQYNHFKDKEYCNLISLKETIYINLIDSDQIMNDMDSKNRNMIRKAIKNGVNIFHDDGDYLLEFFEIYNKTMDNNHATQYYYFKKEYFEYLKDAFKGNIKWFYAVYDGKIVSSSIILYSNGKMHYHLSGTLPEYRNLAANNLLLYEAAIWGINNQLKTFHLGGGLSSNDSLFNFKKKFNKNGELLFYIGRFIFDREKFNKLIEMRKQHDQNFNEFNQKLITYRG